MIPKKHISLIIVFALLLIICGDILFLWKSSNNDPGKNWTGKKIIYPDSVKFVSLYEDNSPQKKDDATYKIFMYADSTGCVSCKLKLPEWESFLETLKSLSKTELACQFVFSTHNGTGIKSLLKGYHFNEPVYIDTNDDFNKLNKFSNNINYQTFLLNKNNKILLVGNPIYDSEVKDKYLNLIWKKE